MQSIKVKYLGPTNTLGSRWVASCEASRLCMSQDYALSTTDNARRVAVALIKKLGWCDRSWFMGRTKEYFLFVDDSCPVPTHLGPEPKKITTTAGTLNSGDKIGNRVVCYSTARDYGMGYHVYFRDSGTPTPYGKDEPITVELAR